MFEVKSCGKLARVKYAIRIYHFEWFIFNFSDLFTVNGSWYMYVGL